MTSDAPAAAVEAACAAARDAFDAYRDTDAETRAGFLEAIGEEIVALGEPLIAAACCESGLPRGRIEGERGRTVGQLRLFAGVLRRGGWMGLRIDPALPDRVPLPRPDLRLRMVPLGPVAVFGASNFPLAFSTAGGDTASALAAGCPVVVRQHPAHPDTAALAARAIRAAVARCGLPTGVFGELAGPGNAPGAALVADPRIAAVGFTGSRAGGLALTRIAQDRAVPIPVYAEMSSINPVILCPAALRARGAALGTAFVGSLTMGAGQFCTNPGLIVAIEGEGLEAFVAAAGAALAGTAAQAMLTPGIHAAYQAGLAALDAHAGVEEVARGRAGEGIAQGGAAFFATTAAAFLADPALGHEVFGASSLLVRCRTEAELRAVLDAAEGQLTATLQMDAGDTALAARLMPLLERKAGRIIANGWPTGVEVSHAMVHSGPFPATSDGRTTSVGSLAIDRFLRPVSYQNLPPDLLPAVLRDGGQGGARVVAEGDARRDRGGAIGGHVEVGVLDDERAGQDMRRDRQGVDAGIEHAEPARLPDPMLAGVPDADILAPRDRRRANLAIGQPGTRRLDPGGVAGVPAREQRDPRRHRRGLQHRDVARRRARRLFQEHVPAAGDGGRGDGAADLRRGAHDDRLDADAARRQFLDRREERPAVDRAAVAADGRDEIEGGVRRVVRLPVANVTKVALGGPDLRTAYVTTARVGLDDAALAAQPQAGDLFAFAIDVPGQALPRPGLASRKVAGQWPATTSSIACVGALRAARAYHST